MTSREINSIEEIVFYMAEIGYAVMALEPTYKFTRGSGKDDEFNWEFSGDTFRSHVFGKSFEKIPLFNHFEAQFKLKGGNETSEDVMNILNGFEADEFRGVDLMVRWQIIPEAGKPSRCDLHFRCGEGTGLGPMGAPNFALSVDNSASREVLEIVDQLGFDESLMLEIQATNSYHFTFLNDMDSRLVSFGGRSTFDRLPDAIKTISAQMISTDIAYLSVTCRVGGCGHPLTVSQTEELIRLDNRQRGKADYMIGMIADILPERDWKFWINAVSADAVFGLDWDRVGSVVETISFERQVAMLKGKGISHPIILSWNGESYRIEIKGLDKDSDLGKLFASFELKFENN